MREKLEKINILPQFSAQTGNKGISLLEFVDDSTLLFCQSPGYILDRVKAISEETFSTAALIADEGDDKAMEKVVDSEAFIRRFAEMKVVKFRVGTTDSGFVPDASVSFNYGPQALYHKNFELISESFRNFISNGYRIFILSDSPYQAERLKNIFEDRGDEIPLRQLTALFMRDLWIMTARTAFLPTIRYSTVSTNITSRATAPEAANSLFHFGNSTR